MTPSRAPQVAQSRPPQGRGSRFLIVPLLIHWTSLNGKTEVLE